MCVITEVNSRACELMRKIIVTRTELRFFAAELCLSLFRFASPESIAKSAKWKKFAKATTTSKRGTFYWYA